MDGECGQALGVFTLGFEGCSRNCSQQPRALWAFQTRCHEERGPGACEAGVEEGQAGEEGRYHMRGLGCSDLGLALGLVSALPGRPAWSLAVTLVP